jgi:hypothetical protein
MAIRAQIFKAVKSIHLNNPTGHFEQRQPRRDMLETSSSSEAVGDMKIKGWL